MGKVSYGESVMAGKGHVGKMSYKGNVLWGKYHMG